MKKLILLCCVVFILSGCSPKTTDGSLSSSSPAPSGQVSANTEEPSEPVSSSQIPAGTEEPHEPVPSSQIPAGTEEPREPVSSGQVSSGTEEPREPVSSDQVPAATEETSEIDEISSILNKNNGLLQKYIDGSGNALISLVGLGDLMSEVKKESEKATALAEDCLSIVGNCTDNDLLSQYNDSFAKTNLSLVEENDKMKAAKKSYDINAIEDSLKNLLAVIMDYHTLLEQFEEGLR